MGKKKMLIVDDEKGVCDVLARFFTEGGYNVVSEGDAAVAMETFEREGPDCVLLDIKMPKVDGVELLAKLKERRRDVCVIMITGYGTLESAMESMKLGAYDFITKPFDMNYIKELVARGIGGGKK